MIETATAYYGSLSNFGTWLYGLAKMKLAVLNVCCSSVIIFSLLYDSSLLRDKNGIEMIEYKFQQYLLQFWHVTKHFRIKQNATNCTNA